MRLLLPIKQVSITFACLFLLAFSSRPGECIERAFLYDAGQGMLELGALATGNESYALDINDSGQVTGFSNLVVNGSNAHAFLWADNINGGTMTDLGTLGGAQSVGRAINNSGRVVGESQDASSQYRAFIWDSTGGMQAIGTLGGNTSKAYDINTTGRVVGYSLTAGGATHAFIWDSTNGMRDIGTLTGGTESYAYGINDAGLVVGYSNRTGSSSTFYLFTWDSTNAANPLNDLGIIVGERLKNAGINASGQIGGHYLAASPNSHGFFYNGARTDIGVLTGDIKSMAFAINNSGQVVGYSSPSNHGVVWSSATGLVDFSAPYLGTTDRCFAYSINNLGQIVGGKTPNTPPDPPVFTYPTNGATNVPLAPELTTGPFHDADTDPVDTHARTRWQISKVPYTTPPTATDYVLDITSTTHLTSLAVPDSLLLENTVYYLRACFFDSRGARSNWSTVVSFTTVTIGDDLLPSGGNGVPDLQDVDASVDLDANGTPDISQTDLRAVNTVIGRARIAIKHLANVTAIARMQSVDPADIDDIASPRPEMIPLGLINLRLSVTAPGAIAQITAYLSDPAPTNEWYKYDSINGWQDYSSHVVYANPNQLTIELQDGGFGDADGVANGVIIDPSGFGFAASPNAPNPPVLFSPANAENNVLLTPTLQTDPANGYFDLDGDAHLRTIWEISIGSGFIPAQTYQAYGAPFTNLESFAVPEGVLSSSTRYYWRVKYVDIFYAESNWSNWDTAPFYFNTLNLGPAAPALLSPAPGATEVSRIPTLTVDTDSYSDPEGNLHAQTQFQVSDAMADFEPPNTPDYSITLSTGDLFSHTIPEVSILNRNTQYFWRVCFYDDQGSVSNWSVVYSFTTTANTRPAQPHLFEPLNTTPDVILTPTLRTEGVNDFFDLDGDLHNQTQWQVSTDNFATITYNLISNTHLTELTLPDSVLNPGVMYSWRVSYYDNYTPVGISDWSVPFTFTTSGQTDDANGNGIPDAQEVSALVDLDGDGTPDINQTDIKSVNTLVGEQAQIGVKISTGVTAISATRSVNPATITDTTGRPQVIPLGLIRFTVAVSPGSTGTVLIYHTDPAPLPAWYAYDSISGWQDLSGQAAFSANLMVVTLSIADGGPGDADGIANGAIVHTGGFGFPASPNPPNPPVLSSPANDATGISLAPMLQTGIYVDPDLNAHLRTIWEISTDSTFSQALTYRVFGAPFTNLESFTVPGGVLSSSTRYYWRVKFVDIYYAESNWSNWDTVPFYFTTLNLAPTIAPAPESPAPGATEVSRTPMLTVNDDAGYYSDPETNPHAQTHWQISGDPVNFDVPVYDLTSSTDLTSHTIPPASILGRTTLYHWRVCFYDDQGSISEWSPVSSFTTTANTVPVQPTLDLPANGADVGATPLLQTQNFSDPDGDGFAMTRWQISTDSGFTTIVYDEQNTLNNPPNITVPDMVLNSGTLYYWHALHYDNYTPNGISPWSAAFTFTTLPQSGDANANGIPDAQEVQAYVDLDVNGTPDINQTDIKSVNTVVGNGRIGVKAGSGVTSIAVTKSVDPASIADTANRPDVMPLGLIGFKVTVANPGDTGTIVVYLSDQAPLDAWYQYTADIGWLDNTSQAVFSANRKMVTLTIQDGQRGDSDHTANGVIVHLGGFGFPASAPPDTPTLLSPEEPALSEALTPALMASALLPVGQVHYKTRWQLCTDPIDFVTNIVLDITTAEATRLNQLTVPEAILSPGTQYHWRVQYTNNYYATSLPSTALSFTTSAASDDLNANGIPDLQELDPVIDMDVDLDNNGAADLGQADIKCLQSQVATFGNEMIGVQRTAGISNILRINSIDPAAITDTNGRPERMPFGLISMKLEVPTAGQNAQVVLHFSDPAPLAAWYAYDTASGWQDMTSIAVFSADRKTVTLAIQEGAYGDQDGAVNGIIVHTGGFGFPASPHAPDTPVISAPIGGSTGVVLVPTLQASAFADSDPGDSHFKTFWQISTDSAFTSLVLERIGTGSLTSLPIPYGTLAANTIYYWRCRYFDNYYTASGWSGYYRVPPASDWTETVAFTTGTDPNDANSNGIPDIQEVGDGVDLDANGTPDNIQTDMKSVNTAIGAGQMGIKTSTNVTSIDLIQSVDPAILPDGGDGRPTSMPLGILDFRITLANLGDTAQVVIYFSQPAPAAQWYKYDPINSWQDFSNHAVFAADMRSVTLTLKDGAFGDADGIINRVIIDPSGPGKFIENAPVPTPPPSSTDSGGGCFIGSMVDK